MPGGGVTRLALTDEEREARDLVVRWMADLGLEISVDRIGNLVGARRGVEQLPPVVIGSHLDSVVEGGIYDGPLGVLAGLEILERMNEEGIETRHPVAVAVFTNEEGARFTPDMMGSGVSQGCLELAACLEAADREGRTVGEELSRIGYLGETDPRDLRPACFLELHVEQGPVLEEMGLEVGAATGVQGISWTEFLVSGVSSHAGTTPMDRRRDAGFVAARIAAEARRIASELGPPQVATVGVIELSPNVVNVVPERARLTVDLRNTRERTLQAAEERLEAAARRMAEAEGCGLEVRRLARFAPVDFDPGVIAQVEDAARTLGLGVARLPSGAGHDAQMFAPNCPTGMVFIPSRGGLSHTVREYSAPEHIRAGATVLFAVALRRSGVVRSRRSP